MLLTAGHFGRGQVRHRKTKQTDVAMRGEFCKLAAGRGVEGDVDYGFQFDGSSLFGGGAELPLA